MLPTPTTSHVDYSRIYEPAEDSFLLIDTLSSQAETTFLHHRFPAGTPTPLVLEVGVGSGVVLAFVTAHVSQLFGRSDVATLGTDVNLSACVAGAQTIQIASRESHPAFTRVGLFLDCLNGDLATAVKPESVDVLIFNPPYVPSEGLRPIPMIQQSQCCEAPLDGFMDGSNLLSLSTDGGLDGMEITTRLLDDLDRVLSRRGITYILLCAQNKPDHVISKIRSRTHTSSAGFMANWRVEKVSSSGKKAGWERLCVLRIWRVSVD